MMNRMLIAIALVALAPSFTPCAPSETSTAKTAAAASPSAPAESAADIEKALLQMERDWMEAVKNKDKSALERLLADDYVGISWDGKTSNKADSIAANLAPDRNLASYTLDPLKVRVFGDTAVVTGGDTKKGSFKGNDTSGKYAWTDVYAKRNGRWQAVFSHSSRFPEEKSDRRNSAGHASQACPCGSSGLPEFGLGIYCLPQVHELSVCAWCESAAEKNIYQSEVEQ